MGCYLTKYQVCISKLYGLLVYIRDPVYTMVHLNDLESGVANMQISLLLLLLMSTINLFSHHAFTCFLVEIQDSYSGCAIFPGNATKNLNMKQILFHRNHSNNMFAILFFVNNQGLEPFSKFRVPRNRFWDPFSNLGLRPEPVPKTLQNLRFLRVPVPVGPEPFSKFRVPRNRFWNPFFRVPRNLFWNPFSNLRFFQEPVKI
jgi:hypothetical protein